MDIKNNLSTPNLVIKLQDILHIINSYQCFEELLNSVVAQDPQLVTFVSF